VESGKKDRWGFTIEKFRNKGEIVRVVRDIEIPAVLGEVEGWRLC
jgi:hypothetical protein